MTERKSKEMWDREVIGPPEIGAFEVEKMDTLGDGSFGTVFKGRCRSKDVAVKVLHRQDLDQKTLSAFRKEVEIMSKIFHPNIVLFMGACTVPGNMMIVTELLDRDMESLLGDDKVPLSLLTRMRMMKDAALGMTWLHCSNPVFIHRDLKPSNLLIDKNYNVKICDFGLSQIKKRGEVLMDGAEGAKGTPLWMAPEVLMGQQFNEKADVYSYGIVLWEVLTRSEPFSEFDNFEDFRYAVCTKKVRPAIPPDCNQSIRRLIELCWHHDPNRRPSFPTIVDYLDYILVDCAINDVHGRFLWKERFLKQDSVDWDTFLKVFEELVQAIRKDCEKKAEAESMDVDVPIKKDEFSDKLQLNCLRAVVAEAALTSDGSRLVDAPPVVNIERFGKVLDWFGPIVEDGWVNMMDRIVRILKSSWFHGDCTVMDAENRLHSRETGTFLIRFSSTHPGGFTISKVANDKNAILHMRIMRTPRGGSGAQGFVVNNSTYNSLEDLVRCGAMELQLKKPCPGSPYESLFGDMPERGYVQTYPI